MSEQIRARDIGAGDCIKVDIDSTPRTVEAVVKHRPVGNEVGFTIALTPRTGRDHREITFGLDELVERMTTWPRYP